ncbi:MAG: PIN domain-containing protein [Dehalococcoidia bacterium]
MSKSLVDTDILSELRRAVNRTVVANAATYRLTEGRITISSVSVAEVVQGYQRIQRDDLVTRFLRSLQDYDVLAIDIEAGILAGRIRGDLQRTGQSIGWADPLIAAIALCHGLTLVTGNTIHYQRIQASGILCAWPTGVFPSASESGCGSAPSRRHQRR